MFAYFGQKRSYIDQYPEPLHPTIIEPFAGSASYSLHYWKHNVILIEKDKRICNIWTYLINTATKERIMSFPMLEAGDTVNDAKFEHLEKIEKELIGYFLSFGARPSLKASQTHNSWTPRSRQKLADNVHKVKHWKLINTSYEDIEVEGEATWFIDPPYQGKGGSQYTCGNKHINYTALKEWVSHRKGQVIVCENEEATWIPLVPIKTMTQNSRKHTEMMFYFLA